MTSTDEVCDVVVVGSGIAGLSCAALLRASGLEVRVLESHDEPGGCAHGWTRSGYHFESGPSLYSGFSSPSPNPLAAIFRIIGETPEWLTYDRWGTVLPEGKFATKIGPDEFATTLKRIGGPGAEEDWALIMAELLQPGGVADAAQALSPLLLREDAGAVVSLLRNFGGLKLAVKQGAALNAPFSTIIAKLGIKNKFVLNWLDLLTFLLQGLPSDACMNAVIGYMIKDWYSPSVALDFPRGGSSAIISALVRGVEKREGGAAGSGSGKVITNAHVDEVLVEQGRAVGVRARNTRGDKATFTIRARRAVVANCDLSAVRKLVAPNVAPEFDTWINLLNDRVPLLKSFIHLHAGIDASGLPTLPSADLPAQWAVVGDWERGVEAPRNVVLVSVPSLIDPSLAPPGRHIIHAYVPATEDYADWQGMDRASPEYKSKKADAADFLWKAVEQYIPDARSRSDSRVEQIGTPLTHERFLRRSRGSYGPRIPAGMGGTDLLPALPQHKTPLRGLYLCGDYSFPGVGVPAAAASGAVTANTILSLPAHLRLLKKAGL